MIYCLSQQASEPVEYVTMAPAPLLLTAIKSSIGSAAVSVRSLAVPEEIQTFLSQLLSALSVQPVAVLFSGWWNCWQMLLPMLLLRRLLTATSLLCCLNPKESTS